MDPNAALDNLYAAVDALAAAVDQQNRGAVTDALVTVMAGAADLDMWIWSGGFLPQPAPVVLTDAAVAILTR